MRIDHTQQVNRLPTEIPFVVRVCLLVAGLKIVIGTAGFLGFNPNRVLAPPTPFSEVILFLHVLLFGGAAVVLLYGGRDDVRALYNHDPNYVLGRTAAGTLRLAEDATGLRYEIDPPATQWAADVLVTVGRGDVSGSSFGFEVNTDAWEYPPASSGQLPLRTIRAVTLYDVSAVTYPAYAETTAEARAKAAPPVSAAVLEAARAAEALMGATVVRQKRQAILEALL